MHPARQNLIRQLSAYPATAFEAPFVAELLSYIQNSPTCFERIRGEGAQHITASVLLVNQANQALFLWHNKIRQWVQPGGHCDGEEDVLAVARKELAEETGIKHATFHPRPLEVRRFDYDASVFGYRKSIYSITFLAQVGPSETPRICEPDKCGEMRWMDMYEARQALALSPYPNTVHLVDKWEGFKP